MKKLFTLLATALFATATQAVILCPTQAPGLDFNPTTEFSYRAAPAPFGTGTWPTIVVSPSGKIAWWYATDGFTYFPQFASATTEKLSDQAFVSSALATLRATDPAAAMSAFARANATDINDPAVLDILCPVVTRIFAERPATVRYVVRSNGTYTTRPAYAFANGTTGIQVGSVLVGTQCDCVSGRMYTAGNNLLCTVPVLASNPVVRVAQCVRPAP